MNLSPYAKTELDREFRYAAAQTGSSSDEVRMARALMTVDAIDARPAYIAQALNAAARLVAANHLSSQIIRNYRHGGITYDLVNGEVRNAR